MGITLIPETTTVVPETTTKRSVVERTRKVEISTELGEVYYALVSREWVFYVGGKVDKRVFLPVLRIPIDASVGALATAITAACDAAAETARAARAWPRIDGVFNTPAGPEADPVDPPAGDP